MGGRGGGGGAGTLEIGTVGINNLVLRYPMVLGQVNAETRFLEESHRTKLANIWLLASVSHLVESSLVWVFKLFVTI